MNSTRIWTLYLVLLVLSVPWYWPASSGEIIVLGWPLWAAVSLACYLAAAVLTVCTIDRLWFAQAGADREPGAEDR